MPARSIWPGLESESYADTDATPLPGFAPPSHLPALFSHSTVPKELVLSTLALKEVSFSHFFDSASRSSWEGKVF